MFKKLTAEEQVERERQRSLKKVNEQTETEKLMLEQMVDMDFRQSMAEMGVM